MTTTTRLTSRAQPQAYAGQLPAADGAERDLLLLVQANADALDELLEVKVLRADDFAQPQRADFWRCIEWAMAQGRGFDLQAVYDEWQRRIPADRYPLGTFGDLSTLKPALGTDGAPIHVHSWRALAGLIVEKAMQRASLKAFSRIGAEDYARKGGEVARQQAQDGRAFGVLPIERSGRVLLLALEDSEQSLQERLQAQGEELPDGLDIITMDADPPFPRWNEGGREWLERYCEEWHPVAIFIDVVQKIRPRRQRGDDWYQVDHDFAAELTAFAHRHHVALWGAHHCSKASREDPLDEVSGTTGFTGGFDNVLAIRRLPAGQQQASHTIYGRGRRLRELEWGLRFDPDLCLWTAKGGLEDSLMGAERARIVALLRQSGPLMPQAIAERLNKNHSTTRTLLEKMAAQGTLVHTTAGYEVFHRTASDDCKPIDSVDNIDSS